MIADARDAAALFTSSLPGFVVQQGATRHFSPTNPPVWQPLEVVTAELEYAGGKEDYREIQIDGRATTRPVTST